MNNLSYYLRRFCIPTVVGCLLFLALPSRADRVALTFTTTSLTDGSVVHTGMLIVSGTVDPFNSNAIDIYSVTGNIDGRALYLGSTPAGANSHHSVEVAGGNLIVNNVLYQGDSPFDQEGLFVTDGTYSYNFTGDPSQLFTGGLIPSDLSVASSSITYSVISGVPEPGTLSLCGTGALALAGFARRRRD